MRKPRRRDMQLRLKRVYEEPDAQDGRRVLVDRIWPRGLRKEDAKIDLWLKGIAPSTELRKWFGHDPKKWPGFKLRYYCELNKNSEAVQEIMDLVSGSRVTLLFGAKDPDFNNAVALKEYLEARVSFP